MASKLFLLSILAALSRASPVPEAAPAPQGISLPPLIPYIPGVTPPISSNAPPLPIIQVPTPPLASPPFTASNIKPKKIGYFWTASGNNQNKDFLATYSLDDDTFGTLLWVTDVPTSGNSPHHLGSSADGKTLIGGGLLSLLKTQDTAFYFDTTNPYRPQFKKSNRGILSSIVDEIRAKPDGGFLITYMGSAAGTAPGRLVETNADGDIIAEHPKVTDLSSTANILSSNFNPHGLSIDFARNYILTSDFVVPVTILKPTLGIIRDDTLRLWSYNDRKIISTITIPGGGGIQDVKFVPNHPEGAAIATACTLGQVWAIYPGRINPVTNTRGVAELLYDLGPKARNEIAIYTDLTADGRFLYLSLTNANHIAALDISDFDNVKRLDNPDEDQPTIGPHYLKVTPDQKHLVATDYFVQTGDIGIVNSPADFKALYIDILPNGALKFGRSIDFQREFANRGGAKPHSSVVFDLTDPAKPIYY